MPSSWHGHFVLLFILVAWSNNALATAKVVSAIPATPSTSTLPQDPQQYVSVAGELIPVRSGVPLYDYVSAEDKNFKWYDTGMRVEGEDFTGYMLNMTSQQWLNSNLTTSSIWWHQVLIVKPKKMRVTLTSSGTTAKDAAFLLITGGSNQNPKAPKPNDRDVQLVARPAVAAGTLGAVLWQVPNQAQVFSNDPLRMKRSEDEIVAYTWKQYVDNPTRPDWVAYLPMVKAAVSAMNTVQQWAEKNLVREYKREEDGMKGMKEGNEGKMKGVVRERQSGDDKYMSNNNNNNSIDVKSLNIAKFVVTGMSKRGATTWLTGAYDSLLPLEKRKVAAIIPIVFDILNIEKNMQHMYQSLNGWTWQFNDYWVNNITVLIGDQDKKHTLQRLANVVDPYEYYNIELNNNNINQDKEMNQVIKAAALSTLTSNNINNNININSNGYRTLKKLIMTGTGDEFFFPDNNWYWWDEINTLNNNNNINKYNIKDNKLIDINYLYSVPNNDHAIATDLVNKGSVPFYSSVLDQLDNQYQQKYTSFMPQPTSIASTTTPNPDNDNNHTPVIPNYSFTIDPTNGRLVLKTSTKPSLVTLNYVDSAPTTPIRRDYRMFKPITPTSPCDPPYTKVSDTTCQNNNRWQEKEYEGTYDRESGLYIYDYLPPVPQTKGVWHAAFFMIHYDIFTDTYCESYTDSLSNNNNSNNINGSPCANLLTTTSSTQVTIVPRTFPYAPCAGGEACRGELI